MLLCEKVDIDLVEEKSFYINATETIAYLQDVVKGIENRVLSGEKINGFEVKEGNKKRVITEEGLAYLVAVLGKETVIQVIEKPIGITDLDNIVSKEEMAHLITKGVVAFEVGKPKVVIQK